MARRERRRKELEQQRALTLQSVERMTSILILPHPERSQPEVRRLQPDPEVENIAMRLVMEHETARGCQVYDIHEKNLGYDITSLDLNSGELRLIEVKGIGAATALCCSLPTSAASPKTAATAIGYTLSRDVNQRRVYRSRLKILRGFRGTRSKKSIIITSRWTL